MGVLPEAPRGWRARGRGVHPAPHHSRHREGVRRFRGRGDRQKGHQARARFKLKGKEMAIEGRGDGRDGGRIRLGMIGGGEGAFIGAVHRLAARMDDKYALVAGALSSTPEKSQRSGAALGLAPDRVYGDFETMARAEAQRADGVEAVARVTANHMHASPAYAFLTAVVHVICGNPLPVALADAKKMRAPVEESGVILGITHNHSGCSPVR